MNKIDVDFDFRIDAKGGDPDITSPTLRKYHKILWSKPLPNGKIFELSAKSGFYLYHKSEFGEFSLGSDAITHSYKYQKRKQRLIQQIPNEVDELYNAGCTIGAYIVFPNKKQNGNTINQDRGCNYMIDDRFDLTLECIRKFYLGQDNPLYNTFFRYKEFFDLFDNFKGYVDFFLLQDLVDEHLQVKFYLPFDNFITKPIFTGVDDYLLYKKGVLDFITKRNKRISKIFNKE
jgi:hypothetical protein